jgi:FixJ family two-component response regulator
MYRMISTVTTVNLGDAMDRPTVFVVDDDVSVRESLELLIGSAGWRPMLFDSAQSFLEAPMLASPCCLVLDVNMPGLNGLDLQGMITESRSRMPIIFVSGFGDVPMTVKALKGGALDFLTKPIDTMALLDAVRSALAQSEAMQRDDSDLSLLLSRYEGLTKREREVMVRVVKGLLNKQVAYELDISEVTVKAHRGQVMRKMCARTLPDLVNIAARLELDEPHNVH